MDNLLAPWRLVDYVSHDEIQGPLVNPSSRFIPTEYKSQFIHGKMQVAMWLEILSLRNIRHTDNRGVVDARDKTRLFT